MVKMMKYQQYIICTAFIMLLMGCQPAQQEAKLAKTVVSAVTLAPTELNIYEELPGRVSAVRVAEIRSQVSGIVQRRIFEQGSEVKAGQPLFQINAAPFKADADMAQAALQRAKAALSLAVTKERRLQPLVASEAVSKQVYDDAVSQLEQAKAEVAQAQAVFERKLLDLKFTTVESPIAGRIDQAIITEGALVSPSDTSPMARVQQINQVYVDVRQPASSLDNFQQMPHEGLDIAILKNNGEPYPVKGQLLFSSVNVDPNTGDVLLRVLVDNTKRILLPGMFVLAKVQTTHYANALMVPQQAIVYKDKKQYVWVVDQANKAHLAQVRLGQLIDRQYHIVSGVTNGQRVVTEGGDRLSEGAEVDIKKLSATESAQKMTAD